MEKKEQKTGFNGKQMMIWLAALAAGGVLGSCNWTALNNFFDFIAVPKSIFSNFCCIVGNDNILKIITPTKSRTIYFSQSSGKRNTFKVLAACKRTVAYRHLAVGKSKSYKSLTVEECERS